MKSIKLLLIGLLLAVITSCSRSDDNPDPTNTSTTPLISKIIRTTTYDQGSTHTYEYDSQKRLLPFTYEAGVITRYSGLTYPNGNPRNFTKYILDNQTKNIIEVQINTQHQMEILYLRYDSQNRIDFIEAKTQYLDSSNGYPNTYLLPSEKTELTYENNNLKRVKRTDIRPNVSQDYSITEFSDFSDVDNTISYNNIGFNHFGKYGLGNSILGQGIIGGLDHIFYIGEKMPKKKVRTAYTATGAVLNSYSEDLTYTVDSKKRITQMKSTYMMYINGAMGTHTDTYQMYFVE